MFCGGLPLTREHAWPLWFSELLYVTPENPVRHVRERKRNTPEKEWFALRIDDTAKRVCRTCNTGWLAALEAAAQSALTRLMRIAFAAIDEDGDGPSQTIEIPDGTQRLLALWASKTAMIMEHLGNDPGGPLIPEEHARWLFEHREPPPNYSIWAGCYSGEMAAFHRRPPLLVPGFGLGFVVTLSIGPVVFHLVGTERLDIRTQFLLDDSPMGRLFGFGDEHLVPIWPMMPNGVIWPPDMCFDEEALHMLANPEQISLPVEPEE